MASVFSSSWASLPIHTNTCGDVRQLLVTVSCPFASFSNGTQHTNGSALPVPRCPGSWRHPWPGRLVSSLQVPPQSEQRRYNVNTSLQIHCLCMKWEPWTGFSVTEHKWSCPNEKNWVSSLWDSQWSCLSCWSRRRVWVGGRPSCPSNGWRCDTRPCLPMLPRNHLHVTGPGSQTLLTHLENYWNDWVYMCSVFVGLSHSLSTFIKYYLLILKLLKLLKMTEDVSAL